MIGRFKRDLRRVHMVRFLLASLTLAAIAPALRAEDKFFLRDGQRVVFLGDSNTFAGHYVAYLDAYLFTRFPDRKYDLINLGLPSETACGLSEPDHPYPRPDVHERIDRALTKTKPDVVVLCYGMNDGIYYPFSEERFKRYQDGMRDAIERVRKAGAKVVVVTPPPFDPAPLKDKLLPKTADKFSWMRPYEGYDDVLKRYSDWLLTLRDKGVIVADAHGAILHHLAEARKIDPKYSLSGDGVHVNPSGHWLIAQAILQAWDAPAHADAAVIDAKAGKATAGDVSELTTDDGGLRFTWRTRLPMPSDPAWNNRLAKAEKIADLFNRYRLTVKDAPHEKYELWEGERKLVEVGREELAAGVDLTRYKELSTNVRAAELGKWVAEREQLLALAWLTDVGHKRPDTPKGIPLADARKQAAELEAKIRKLAEPTKITLRLVPMRK
jgi:lysophospholipase L1-like esterase